MELHERIAFVRKAAGLTQEQLGEKLGVTRQAVSKWESNQATPDTATIVRLCVELKVSADFLLLGKEPEAAAAAPAASLPTVTCPCCGKVGPTSAPRCQGCGYGFYPMPPDDEKRYAVILRGGSYAAEHLDILEKFTGWSRLDCQQINQSLYLPGAEHREFKLARRGLPRSAALYIAARLCFYANAKIVADDPVPGYPGQFADEETLEQAPQALENPTAIRSDGTEDQRALSFWGIVGAVLLALLIAAIL